MDTCFCADLVRDAQRGDAAALEALVERYRGRVAAFSRSICVDRTNAEDVSQDTLLAMVRSLKQYRGDADLASWLYAIARHACLKRRRRTKSSPAVCAPLDGLGPADADRLAAPDASPETVVAAAEATARLHAAIRLLEVSQRDVLVLRDVMGLTAPETARALGLSVAAVKSRLHRARTAVRASLGSGRTTAA
ncbi:MAG: sigma-70 family RNA polymerase sigma factor [Vicinamibacterales bacterium]